MCVQQHTVGTHTWGLKRQINCEITSSLKVAIHERVISREKVLIGIFIDIVLLKKSSISSTFIRQLKKKGLKLLDTKK